jgi:integrase
MTTEIDLNLTRSHKTTVKVMHAKSCPYREKGANYTACDCVKQLYIRHNGKTLERTSNERVWSKAQKEADKQANSFDPILAAAQKIIDAKQRTEIVIEDAIIEYMESRWAQVDQKQFKKRTMQVWEALLGHVDRKSKEITTPGALLRWVQQFNAKQGPGQRLENVGQITNVHLEQYRNAFGKSPLDAAPLKPRYMSQRWGRTKTFFAWLVGQHYLEMSPASKLANIRVTKAQRQEAQRGALSDAQFAQVLAAVDLYVPKGKQRLSTRTVIKQRIRAFLLTMRWCGTALEDTILLQPHKFDANGVLSYQRIKTGEWAEVPMPKSPNVIQMLGELPGEEGSDPAYYFARKRGNRDETQWLDAERARWAKRIDRVIQLSGATHVRIPKTNALSKVTCHTFRDSCAVFYLMAGLSIPDVARILGHSQTSTTERHYAPWIEERSKQHTDRVRKAQEQVLAGNTALEPEAPVSEPVEEEPVLVQ